jgi:shikimate dehydrogenase
MKNIQISGKTTITGIFGFPVKHSMSPAMHNAAFKKLSLDLAYLPFEVHPAKIGQAVASLKALNIRGVNVTIPHKESVLEHLDSVDPLAKKIGSVNTIVNENGKLTGYNTDGPGFLKDLKSHGFSPKGKTILIVGAGGAGKAISHTLSHNGAKKVYIFDIDTVKLTKLVKHIPCGVAVAAAGLVAAAKESSLLVNTTPIGMHSGDALPLPKDSLHKGLFVYDIIYNRPTELVRTAKKMGLKTCNGLGMLLNQGVLAFEKWTKRKAPVKLMEQTLLSQLGGKA